MSATVIARGVSFEFPNGRELFTDLSLSLSAHRSALVGPNGVGKTTLAAILAGDLQPTRGEVRRSGPIALLKQRQPAPSLTVAQFLSADYEWQPHGTQLLAPIDLQAPCTSLSGGQWMRVRLARALQSRFLILDEPTNDLDRDGRAAVVAFIRQHSGGVLLISHDRECLQVCDEILELSNRGLLRCGSGWSDYVEAREREQARLSAELDAAKRERDAALRHRNELRARQERRTRRGAASAARGGMPKILLGARKRRAEVSTGKLDVVTITRAENRMRNVHAALTQMKLDPVMYADLLARPLPAQKLIAEAQDFNVRFQDWIYRENLNFSWRGGVRVALRGANGSGKSTLITALLGEESLDTRGRLRRGDLTTLYVDQRCSSVDDNLTVLDNVRATSPSSESQVRNELARFLFSGDAVFQKVRELSGGERLRAALARGLLNAERPELLILDEPTNNLDLANQQFLEGLLRAYQGALVIASHDEAFLQNCQITGQLTIPMSSDGYETCEN
jgi:ATPase subunit of ABC transporter with duplicated ATPase domains